MKYRRITIDIESGENKVVVTVQCLQETFLKAEQLPQGMDVGDYISGQVVSILKNTELK